MKVLTKAKLANVLRKREPQLSLEEANSFTDAFFQILSDELVQCKEVKLANFGRFAVLKKNERMARNPKTGEPVLIPARRVVTFYPSQKLRTVKFSARRKKRS